MKTRPLIRNAVVLGAGVRKGRRRRQFRLPLREGSHPMTLRIAIVAFAVAGLFLQSAWSIIRDARQDLAQAGRS